MNTLTTRSNFNTMARRMLDDLFNDLSMWRDPELSELFHSEKKPSKFSYPRINVRDSDTNYTIEASVPGMSKDDVSVEYEDGRLTISGKSQNTQKNENGEYVLRELHKSSFSRSIALDEDRFDVHNINADMRDGMLTVTVPKTYKKKDNKKKIQVN